MVADKCFWGGKEVYVAVNATHVEHVLTFKVGTVTPAEYLYADIVLSLAHIGCYVKFGIVGGTLRIACIMAVHPDVGCTVYTVKVEEYAFIVPSLRE